MSLYDAIAGRQSVRKYSAKEVPEKLRGQILSFAEKASRLNDRIGTEIEILDDTKGKAQVKGIWKVESPYYLVFYTELEKGYARNAGYILEQVVLYMAAKGLGSCFLGGSKPRHSSKNGKKAVMVVAFGYPEGRLFRESPLAKRLPLSELCVFKEEAGEQMKTVLRAARLAPSAFNSQPWRFVVYTDRIYVFAKKSRFLAKAQDEMKDFSIGIMLAHIMLAAEELWMELVTTTEEQFAAKAYKNGDYVTTLSLH